MRGSGVWQTAGIGRGAGIGRVVSAGLSPFRPKPNFPSEFSPRGSSSPKGAATAAAAKQPLYYSDFMVYTVDTFTSCSICNQEIVQGEVKLRYKDEKFHMACALNKFEHEGDPMCMRGFFRLEKQDRDHVEAVAISVDQKSPPPASEREALDKHYEKLKRQELQLAGVARFLDNTGLTVDSMNNFLIYNKQPKQASRILTVERVIETACFGPLEKCGRCGGNLYRGSAWDAYYCDGAGCTLKTQRPGRFSAKFPTEAAWQKVARQVGDTTFTPERLLLHPRPEQRFSWERPRKRQAL